MDKSEPTLVPEWLKSPGSGNSAPHFALSPILHSDSPSAANKIANISNNTILERASSSNSRRTSGINGITKHPYSSFSRSHRDKEKERLSPLSRWELDRSDSIPSILGGRSPKDGLRRSRSMISSKRSDVLPQRSAIDSKTKNSNGSCLGPIAINNSIQKAAFNKNFPLLGDDEIAADELNLRVLSPCLSTSVQSLSIGNSSSASADNWTSVLINVPSVIASNNCVSSSTQQVDISTHVSGPPSITSGLNMAEALAQAPLRSQTAPELSLQNQRLAELALKQSRQLVPMTPSTFKSSVLNSSDKVRPKLSSKTSELATSGKSSQHISIQSLRGAAARSDNLKTSHVGKFLVLKPERESGISFTPKDVSSAMSNDIPAKSNPIERKPSLTLNTVFPVERRPLSSQAKSRSDFFNLVRKKSSVIDSAPTLSCPCVKKSNEEIKVVALVNHQSDKNGADVTSNGDACDNMERICDGSRDSTSRPNGGSGDASENIEKVCEERDSNLCPNGSNGDACENTGRIYDGRDSNLSPNGGELSEEDIRFLISLGWVENAGEDEGLTEEEINAFVEEHMKPNPSLKLRIGMQTEFPEMSSANSESEA